MLEFMRKHARNWLMKVLLGIVILVFIFYFGSTRGKQKADAIATIEGKSVSHVDFQKEYMNLADFYRQRYGGTLTDEMLKGLNLKQQAYDNLINQVIILQKAKELNLDVSEEEVRASILSSPTFQRGGVFDERIYQQVLRYYKMTAADFESAQQKGLTIARMEDLLQDGVKVSDKEIFDLYRFQSEKIDVSFLTLSTKDLRKAARPEQKELEACLKEHENDYRVPEKIQVKYVSFAGRDLSSSVKVSDEEVTDYYNSHKDQFMKKGSNPVPLSEAKNKIIAELKLIQGMYAAADEAKKAHDIVYQKENFDDYAKQKGLKITTTDFFSSKNPPQEFKQVKDFTRIAFELQTDEISSPLSDSQQYYLLKLVAKKPSNIPALKEIEGEVERQYMEEESRRLYKKEAESILESLKKGEAWEKVSREKGLKTSETGLFLPGAVIPKIGASKELSEALFSISERNPYPEHPFYIDGNYVIVKFRGRGNLDTQDFETKKAPLKNLLLSMKRSELIHSWLENQKAFLIKEGKLKLIKDVKDM